MVLKFLAYLLELLKCFWEFLFHLGDRHWGAHACHHVFALGVGQKLAHQLLLAGCRVTGECNACAAVIAHVAEGHALYVNSCAPGIGDVVVAAVYVCAGVVPRTENGLYGAH